eukprot:s2397_g22.t1
MAVRMIEAKPKRFFKGDESKDEYRVDVMNVFDFIITIMRCLDLWFLSPLGRNNSGFKFASVFRRCPKWCWTGGYEAEGLWIWNPHLKEIWSNHGNVYNL